MTVHNPYLESIDASLRSIHRLLWWVVIGAPLVGLAIWVVSALIGR